MAATSFVVPVLSGKEQAELDWVEEMDGPRRGQYESTWKDLGITRHRIWRQQTADGTVSVVCLEADDIAAAMQGIASSDDEFSQWFRGRIKDVHGIDLTSESPPESTQIHDHTF